MYFARYLLLFTTFFLSLTSALPTAPPEKPTLPSLGLNNIKNLTFITRELMNIRLTNYNAYVKFNTFHDETFGSEEAAKVLSNAKEVMAKGIVSYGEKAVWKDAKFGEGYFWLWFTSFPPVAPDGLSGGVILEIIEQLTAQTQRLWAWNFYVASFDVFEGLDARGRLLGHGTVSRDKPEGWL